MQKLRHAIKTVKNLKGKLCSNVLISELNNYIFAQFWFKTFTYKHLTAFTPLCKQFQASLTISNGDPRLCLPVDPVGALYSLCGHKGSQVGSSLLHTIECYRDKRRVKFWVIVIRGDRREYKCAGALKQLVIQRRSRSTTLIKEDSQISGENFEVEVEY